MHKDSTSVAIRLGLEHKRTQSSEVLIRIASPDEPLPRLAFSHVGCTVSLAARTRALAAITEAQY